MITLDMVVGDCNLVVATVTAGVSSGGNKSGEVAVLVEISIG